MGWHCNACSTELTSITEGIGKEEPVQQDVSQQTTFRACRPGSDPSPATWTPWTAAAVFFAQRRQAGSFPTYSLPEKPPKKGSLLSFVAPRPAAQRCKRKFQRSEEASRAALAPATPPVTKSSVQRDYGRYCLYFFTRAQQV